MLNIYETLEISKVLEEIAFYSKSELAKQRILSLKMLPKEEIKPDLVKLDEMMSYLLRFGDISLTSSFNLKPFIDDATKGIVLSTSELDKIATDIDSTNKIYKQFSKVDKSLYFSLFTLTQSMSDVSKLAEHIHKIILPNLNVADNASTTLANIRSSILKKEHEVRGMSSQLIQKYHDYLSEDSVSIRNGHFVLPVKSAYKNKIDGIIHDFSSSGQTTFIEPSS